MPMDRYEELARQATFVASKVSSDVYGVDTKCSHLAEDTDPPLPTCHCGKRRYCGEECQAKDWAAGHAKTCKSGYLHLEG